MTVRTAGGASGGGSSPTSPPATPSAGGPPLANTGNGPVAPSNATITVYSPTAAELFWTPQIAGRATVTVNEIRRDGQLIATLTGYGTRVSENGSTTSYLVPWSSRFDVVPVNPASADIGF